MPCFEMGQGTEEGHSAHLPPLTRLSMRVDAVNLDQDLRLNTAAGLMLARSTARGAQRIDLVNEDGAGCQSARHLKQATHHTLRLPPACTHMLHMIGS